MYRNPTSQPSGRGLVVGPPKTEELTPSLTIPSYSQSGIRVVKLVSGRQFGSNPFGHCADKSREVSLEEVDFADFERGIDPEPMTGNSEVSSSCDPARSVVSALAGVLWLSTLTRFSLQRYAREGPTACDPRCMASGLSTILALQESPHDRFLPTSSPAI